MRALKIQPMIERQFTMSTTNLNGVVSLNDAIDRLLSEYNLPQQAIAVMESVLHSFLNTSSQSVN